MIRGIFTFVPMLSCCVGAWSDYVKDRRSAIELVKAGQDAEALTAFLKMADATTSEVQKSDALDRAAMCALRLKQDQQAMELALRIPLPPVSKTCQMRLLMENRKWQEVAEKFKDEDLDAWPEYVAAEAYNLRGDAFRIVGEGARAVADLEKAVRYLTNGDALGLALVSLGDAYRDLLKDDARAIESYRKVYQTYNIYKHCAAAMAVAGILVRQQRHAEAIQELNRIALPKVALPYWRGSMLAAFGEALAKQGKRAEALAKYKEALQVEGIYPVQKTAFEKAVQGLEAETK